MGSVSQQRNLAARKHPSLERLTVVENPLLRLGIHQLDDALDRHVKLAKVAADGVLVAGHRPALLNRIAQVLLPGGDEGNDVQDPVAADGVDQDMFSRGQPADGIRVEGPPPLHLGDGTQAPVDDHITVLSIVALGQFSGLTANLWLDSEM